MKCLKVTGQDITYRRYIIGSDSRIEGSNPPDFPVNSNITSAADITKCRLDLDGKVQPVDTSAL